MTTTKQFHLGDLLTVMTQRLLSPNGMKGVYSIVAFVTGEQHLTNQLPRAMSDAAPWLLGQHPWLAEITVPEFDSEEKVHSWLAEAVERWGADHEVEAMPLGMYVGREPVAELKERAPDKDVVIVDGDVR